LSRKLIVVIPALEEALRLRIRAEAESMGFETLFFDREEDALPALGEAEILFSHFSSLPARGPALRWVCTPFAGVDDFLAPGVFLSPEPMLSNSSGAYGTTIAEHIVMTALELLRRQMEYAEIVRRREWVRTLPVRSLRGSRITLLGTGDIGQEAALRLRAFLPRSLTGVSRSGKNPGNFFDRVLPVRDLDVVLPETDLLVISLPATAETRGLLDAERLDLLPDQAVLINVGRGSVLDARALESRLRAGRLSAALDVFPREPLPPDSSLWTCPNLLITPHVAGNLNLPYTRERIVELFLEDLENYRCGRPLARRVDLRRGY